MAPVDTVEPFMAARPYLFAIAYRLLGAATDAEDIVQDAYLRWAGVDAAAIVSPKAYLTQVVTRLCLDQLKSARAQRESYIGEWLPEPIATDRAGQPEERVELAESVSVAFLLLLERLSPSERAAYVLRNAFDLPYTEIAACLETSEANCRQWVKRASDQLAGYKRRFTTTPEARSRLTQAFGQACTLGDIEGLQALFIEDIVSRSDANGKVNAATRPVYGRENVARLMIGLTRRLPEGATFRVAEINGQTALLGSVHARLISIVIVDIVDGEIENIFMMLNPDKLRGIACRLGLTVSDVPSLGDAP